MRKDGRPQAASSIPGLEHRIRHSERNFKVSRSDSDRKRTSRLDLSDEALGEERIVAEKPSCRPLRSEMAEPNTPRNAKHPASTITKAIAAT